MAKRSDFAQKLLGDLHLRKERMVASQSQRSTQSNQLPIDAYAYSKQTYRGSRNGLQVTSRTGDSLSRPSSRSHITANIGEASDQIVMYGRGQNSVQLSDISLALTYAFDNGGKLGRADSSLTSSMMGFLHHIKRGTMEYSKMGRGTNLDMRLATANHFPTFSPGQINEISKGIQKLNQILRACSNGGLNMDGYSIEFAKELLQGAMDLEESLRMLVDLQKNSDSMKNSQKKNHITLKEEDYDVDDDNDDRTTMTSEQRQLAPPTFSFDKSSRKSHKVQDVGNSSLMQRPLALTYSKERRKLSNEKQDVNISKLLPHRQSTSSISDDNNPNALSEQKNRSAYTEKARIPNVIAKLMGLDIIPEKVESGNPSQKDSGSTHKIEGMIFKHTATGSANKSELRSKKTDNSVPLKQQKVIEPVIVPKTQEKELMYVADENLIIQKASSEVAVKNGKILWGELNEIKASKGLEKGTIKVEKQHNNSDKMNLNRESGKDVQSNGRKQVQATKREQKVAVKIRTNDFLLNNMLAQLEQGHERSKVESSLQEEKEGIGSVLQPVKKNMNKKEATNQKKSQNHLGMQKSYALLKYGPQDELHHREKQLQHREKHMLEARLQKGSETALENSSKPSHDLTNSQKKQTLRSQATTFKHNSAENVDVMKSEGFLVRNYNDLNQDEASNEFNMKVEQMDNRKPSQITSTRNQQSEPFTGKHGFTTMMHQKSFHKLANEKVKNTRKKKVSPEKIEEVLTRRNGTMVHSTAQMKQRSPILKEVRETTSESDKFNLSKEAKKEMVSMLKEADARIISSNNSVSTIELLDVRQQPHPEAELAPTLYNSDGGKVEGLQESLDLVPNNLYQDVKLAAADDKQDVATFLAADEKFESCEIAPTTINGVYEESIDINYHSQRQNLRISEKRKREPLTESENCLKWILVTSQPFLNTAEALFKLNIPFSSILQGCGGVDNQDEEGSKLMLDCSYEVMKRKGIRQELKVHSCSKTSISPIKIRSIDDLVRELNEYMEKLKFYGRNRTSPVHVEDYLPKMLENDVYNKYPDIDSMWDMGWNQETFAFLEKYDVTRDLEKQILNGLLDEITWELSNVQGGLH